jgi:hypothetical protein
MQLEVRSFMRKLTKLMLTATMVGICTTAGASDKFRAADSAYVAAGGHLLIAQGNCASLSEAVERVRRQYNGRIVSAETRVSGNREVHHIKVLTSDGKVKTVTVPGCPLRS